MIKSQNRKLIRVTSSNERLEYKCVGLSDYESMTDIWTKFGAELKHHTINTPECANFT